MKRDIIQLFPEWKSRVNRKPLLVRGARQVGKTFAINEFGAQQFASFVSINLEECEKLM
jgi:predicted AAA+ superfamily ATPase